MALVGAGCGLVNLTNISAFGVKGRIGFGRQPVTKQVFRRGCDIPRETTIYQKQYCKNNTIIALANAVLVSSKAFLITCG
jgi:hypothetical protein